MHPQTAEDRRRRQRDEARRAILDATESLLLSEGAERFSIRKLSAACGYAAPTIYSHFGDKEGLLGAVLEKHFGVLLRRLRRVEQGDDPLENLRAITTAFVQFGTRRPTLYRLLINATDDGEERDVPAAEAVVALVQSPLDELVSRGLIEHVDPEAVLQAIWCLMHGLTVLQVNRPDAPWSRHLNEIAIDALLRGLLDPAPLPVPRKRKADR